MKEWYGVDLDGTLAEYNGWKGETVIGKPIPKMQKRVMRLLEEGKTVKIFTARADSPEAVKAIKKWLKDNGFGNLEVTNKKDYGLVEYYDDRAIQVEKNTGRLIGEQDTKLAGQKED